MVEKVKVNEEKEDKKEGAFSSISKKMDKVLSNPKSLTKLLMSLNTITESSRITPLSSGRVKTPIGQISSGITKGLIQGKQIETAETAAAAKWWKSQQKSTKFVLSPVEQGDLAWIKTEHTPAVTNNQKRKQQVDLRYNLLFDVKNDLPTGAIESIIAPFRKLAVGLWEDNSDELNYFNETLTKYMTNDTGDLSNAEIVKFQDQFKALTMEQVIQDAKNLYPVSEADVKRLLDAAGDVGTYSAALKNLVSIQKAVSMSNSYFDEGLNQYYELNDNQTRGSVRFVGANGEIIKSNSFRDFAQKYAQYRMGLDVKDALKDKDVAAVFKKHAMITGEEFNMSKLTNFDKLFTLYSINLLDKTYANLQAVDEQSQYAYLTEQKKLTEEKIEEIQSGITLD